MSEALGRCTKVPLSVATKPRSGVFSIDVDLWWVVIDECILMYRGRSPQCNPHKRMVEKLVDRMYPGAEVRQVPVVYIPMERGDY